MGLQETKIESLPFVTAELNYLAPVSGKPRTYAFDPPPGEPKSTSLPEPHQVPNYAPILYAIGAGVVFLIYLTVVVRTAIRKSSVGLTEKHDRRGYEMHPSSRERQRRHQPNRYG